MSTYIMIIGILCILALSDIQLISASSTSTDSTHRFYKNGFLLKPKPLSFYQQSLTQLSFYVEVYNLNTLKLSITHLKISIKQHVSYYENGAESFL